jgi:hypothetical protein
MDTMRKNATHRTRVTRYLPHSTKMMRTKSMPMMTRARGQKIWLMENARDA